MRSSSIGVTKSLTFYFILIYVFVKMKMCSSHNYHSASNNYTRSIAHLRHQHNHHNRHHHHYHNVHKESLKEAIDSLKSGYQLHGSYTNINANQQLSPLTSTKVKTNYNNSNNIRSKSNSFSNINNSNSNKRSSFDNKYSYTNKPFDYRQRNYHKNSAAPNHFRENNYIDYFKDTNYDEDDNMNTQGDQYNSNNRDDLEDIHSESYVPGSLTDHKFKTLSNREGVEKEHNKVYSEHINAKAREHARKITKEGACKLPKPKLIPVPAEYSKQYVPHCTILYRCDDDSGCCGAQKTCVAKTVKQVELHFYVRSVGSSNYVVEIKTFDNHTECHCVLNSALPRPQYEINTSNTQNRQSDAPYQETCACPKLFEIISENNGSCRCDCSSSNRACDYLKQGREHFSLESRKCIKENKCEIPTCAYGAYMSNKGRCPKLEEKIRSGFLMR